MKADKPKLPRAPVPKPTQRHGTAKRQLHRKRKHKGKEDV